MKKWNLFLMATCVILLFFGGKGVHAQQEINIFDPHTSAQEKYILHTPVIDETGSVGTGQQTIAAAIMALVHVIKYLLGIIGTIFLVFGGVRLVAGGGNDDQVEKGKRGVTWGVIGLVAALVVDDAIFGILYGGYNAGDLDATLSPTEINTRIANGTQLVLDTLNWLQAVVVIGAVGFVIFSGARMMTALGNEEVISKQRTVFLWVGLGLVVILLNKVLVQEILYPVLLAEADNEVLIQYTPNATRGIQEITSVLIYFLKFLGVIAFLVFVYGGIRMVTSFGNDEAVESGKKILTGAAIGIIIILMSFVVVSTLISGNPNG